MKKGLLGLAIISLLWSQESEARNFPIVGANELSGGIGVSADITDWTPGGFKWFNDYSRQLSQLTWLNFQFNITAGGRGGTHCWVSGGRQYCDYNRFGGTALEAVAGVKFKWRMQSIPLQIHAKLGGTLVGLFFDVDYKGVGFGFRGGAGIRYFFLPTFGVGAELVNTLGPSFINHDVGMEFMANIDFNFGVEWRF